MSSRRRRGGGRTRGDGGGRGDGGRGPFDGFAPGSSLNVSSGIAYFASQDRMGRMSSEQREGLDRMLGADREVMDRHIAESGADPRKVSIAPPTILDNPDKGPSESTDHAEVEDFGPLHEAACTGRMDTCKYLVEELSFDVNCEANNDLGITPLSCAVLRGKSIAVKYLLDKGANPDKQDNKGFAPLHYAAKEGMDRLVRLLLSKGASVNILSCEGTPLHVAASYGKSGIMQILLQHNADPHKVMADLGTPMAAVLSVASGRISESAVLKCMKLLVKAGTNLNFTNPDTPLVIATSKGLSECVEYLLEVGANANIPSNHLGCMTPIEIAATSGTRNLVEILFPFTSPIQSVSNWSVEGIIAHAKLRHSKNKGEQSDKDSTVQLKLNAEKATKKEDSPAPKPCSKRGDKDKKAELKLLGAKAVDQDYVSASKFYSEVKTSNANRKTQLKSNCAKAVERTNCVATSKFHQKSLCSIAFSLVAITLLLLPLAEARPIARISETDLCTNQDLLYRNIKGICISSQPTELCCELVVFAFDNCLCHGIHDGEIIDIFLMKYIRCGGRNTDLVETIKRCPALSPSKAASEEAVSPKNSKSSSVAWLPWVIGFLLILGLIFLIARKLKKKRGASRPEFAAQTELSTRVAKNKRQTADRTICNQQLDLQIAEDVPFLGPLTRGRLLSLKEIDAEEES